jgi:predicted alpha/beta superfamily hydrolase
MVWAFGPHHAAKNIVIEVHLDEKMVSKIFEALHHASALFYLFRNILHLSNLQRVLHQLL